MLGQLAWSILVLTVVVAAMFAGTASTPPVIGHNGILRRVGDVVSNRADTINSCVSGFGTYFDGAVVVEPGKELGGVPVGVRRFPVPIGPDQLRPVPAKQ